MSYLDWHVGMKVVCVADPDRIALMQARVPGSNYPANNRVYTIREIRDDAQWRHGEHRIVVLLHEIDNSHLIGKGFPENKAYCYVEPGFNANGFRPLVTRKTDISIFTAMLHGTDQTVDA